jgi:hypothetical protein
MLRPFIMTKKTPPKAAMPRNPSAPAVSRATPHPSRNPKLNQQTRQVLAQHYRAKYGVK